MKRINQNMNFQSQNILAMERELLVEEYLFESPAFVALRGVAPQMLIYILGERIFKKPNKKSNLRICVNEDQIKLSYIELGKLGITNHLKCADLMTFWLKDLLR